MASIMPAACLHHPKGQACQPVASRIATGQRECVRAATGVPSDSVVGCNKGKKHQVALPPPQTPLGVTSSSACQPADEAACPGDGDDVVPGMMCMRLALNTYCQRALRRSVTKEEIVYTLTSFGDYHQALVSIRCLGGLEFAGDLCQDKRQAMELAAEEALDFHGVKRSARKAKSLPFQVLGTTQAGVEPHPAFTPKVQLNMLCSRLSPRFLVKGDTVYIVRQTNGGFQATVSLSALPDPWKCVPWIGKVCDTQREAEQSAAEAALACLSSVYDLAVLLKTR